MFVIMRVYLVHIYAKQLLGAIGSPKNSISHIDASLSRQPLVKGERLVRNEVNAVMVRGRSLQSDMVCNANIAVFRAKDASKVKQGRLTGNTAMIALTAHTFQAPPLQTSLRKGQ